MAAAHPIDQFTLELGRSSELGMAASIAIMMFAVALNLRPAHFQFLRFAPKPYFLGLVAQLLGLPLITLGLCFVWQPWPSVALGMILIACCPGGNVSNLLVLLSRGNIALSVSLTATSSVAAAFVTPLAIIFWSAWYPPTANLLDEINFDALQFLLQAVLILALPLLLGMCCRAYLPSVAETIRRPLTLVSSGLLLVIIVFGFLKYWNEFLTIGSTILLLVVVHNSLAFALGYGMAKISGLSVADRRALCFEVGIQNSGLGIVILLTQMGGLGGAAAVAGLWGTWHIIAGLIMVTIFRVSTPRYQGS